MNFLSFWKTTTGIARVILAGEAGSRGEWIDDPQSNHLPGGLGRGDSDKMGWLDGVNSLSVSLLVLD